VCLRPPHLWRQRPLGSLHTLKQERKSSDPFASLGWTVQRSVFSTLAQCFMVSDTCSKHLVLASKLHNGVMVLRAIGAWSVSSLSSLRCWVTPDLVVIPSFVRVIVLSTCSVAMRCRPLLLLVVELCICFPIPLNHRCLTDKISKVV